MIRVLRDRASMRKFRWRGCGEAVDRAPSRHKDSARTQLENFQTTSCMMNFTIQFDDDKTSKCIGIAFGYSTYISQI